MNARGQRGEQAAANYLTGAGCEILWRNYRSRFGEIDIIARNRSFLLFVEVKARKRNALVGGLESIGSKKRERIILTARQYLAENQPDLQPRFDVIETDADSGAVVRHLENVFD